MNNDKTTQLEEKNKQLEANIQVLKTQMNESYDSSDEIDLGEVMQTIWKGKWWIIAITSVFSIAAVMYALSLPDQYKSTVLLSPAASGSSSSLSKLAARFGGLASLAGINLNSGGKEDKTVIAIKIIQTWGFLEQFIKDNNIEVEVFAAEGWSRAKNELLINAEIYDSQNQTWVRDFNADKGQQAKPSSWELYEKFIDRISVSQDQETGLISLSVEYYSPSIAKEWTDKLVKAINAHIQKQDRVEATKSIEYLNKKIKETNISDMQTVFYQLIEEQIKNLMLAEVSEEYVFKTLSPAKVAFEKSKPKRAFIAIFGFFFGGIVSLLTVLVRHYFNKSKN